jgi:hypothetical protein
MYQVDSVSPQPKKLKRKTIASTDADKLEGIRQIFVAVCFNNLFPHVRYSYAYALDCSKSPWCTVPYASLSCLWSLPFCFQNMVFEFLRGVSEALHCSVSDFLVKPLLLLDGLQLLILFLRTFTYSEPKLFLLIIFYNGPFLIIKALILYKTNVCVYMYVCIYVCLAA